jgi:vitamin B12 transporter
MFFRKTALPVLLLACVPGVGFPAAATAQDPRPIELDTLRVVVASRATSLATATRSVDVVDAAAIRRIPARTIGDVVAWTLGTDVLARSAAQTDVAVRGSTFEQVLVLVDGVRMNDPQTGHFDWNLVVPLSEVERIEVMRGAASSLYGSDAMGGVIQIVTRRAVGAAGWPALEAGVEAGSFGTAAIRAATGGPVGALRARVSAEASRSDGHRPGTDSRVLLGRATVEGDVAGGPLRADVGLAARDFGARAFYTPPDAPFDEYERTRAATASVAWRTPAAARWIVEPRLSARRHSDEFLLRRDDPDFYRNLHTSWQAGGEVVARGVAAGGVAVSGGAEAYRDVLESTNLGDPAERRAAAFGELAVGREGRAVAHLGLRGDQHSEYGGFVAPSLAGAVWLAPSLRLRASAGRSFRAPNWTERYYTDPVNEGNPGLRPETAWSAEVGAELRGGGSAVGQVEGSAAGDVVVSVGAFIREARDVIDWARPAGGDPVWRAMNHGRATFRGVELDARATDPLGTRWSAQATMLGFTTGEEGWESRYALRPLTRTAAVTAARRVLGADASVRALHATRAGEASYVTLDGRVSRALGGRLRVDVDVTNLLDTTYLDVTGMPAPGRAVGVGLRLRWGPIR